MISAPIKKTGSKRAKLSSLLRQWMAHEADYDAKNWGRAKKAVEQNRLSLRKRFDD